MEEAKIREILSIVLQRVTIWAIRTPRQQQGKGILVRFYDFDLDTMVSNCINNDATYNWNA